MGQSSQEASLSGRADCSYGGWELVPALGFAATTQEALGRLWALPMCESRPGQLTLACQTDGRTEPFWLVAVCSLRPWPLCLRVLELAHFFLQAHPLALQTQVLRLAQQTHYRETRPQTCLPAAGQQHPSQHNLTLVVAVLVW